MFFSPITTRSPKVKALFFFIYALLSVGGLTVIFPMIIMVTGSLQPTTAPQGTGLLPRYLWDDEILWQSYLSCKYNQSPKLLRAAWGDPNADPLREKLPPSSDPVVLKKWQTFLQTSALSRELRNCGFLGTNQLPQTNQRNFRMSLYKKFHGDIERLNKALQTQFPGFGSITPPVLGLTGATLIKTPFIEEFFDFVAAEVGESELIPLNSGGYYRGVFLPGVFGNRIEKFNAQYQTNFASFTEVPYSSTMPPVGADMWFQFVSKLLRPSFVDLTENGNIRFQSSGLARDDFIRLAATPEDLSVKTIDLLYVDWAGLHGIKTDRLPQKEIDYACFLREKAHWKATFFLQNYKIVCDEIFLQGRSLVTTAIFVALSIIGSLLVNPMAAYALSRFKLKQTYHIILFCLVTIAIPAEVTMIPVFLQIKELGMLNTFGALIIPGLANGFSIFLLKGFFDSLPKELYEAAEIDGAGEATMFWQITMSLSRPILAVLALGAFVHAYGAFMYALILCPDPKMWTVMVYLFQLMQSVDTPILYAALIVTAIPTTLVFIFCQNIILRGIVVPSEK